jgi:hypothetical protein
MTSISLIQKNRNSCSFECEGKLATVLGRLSLVAILYEPATTSDACNYASALLNDSCSFTNWRFQMSKS